MFLVSIVQKSFLHRLDSEGGGVESLEVSAGRGACLSLFMKSWLTWLWKLVIFMVLQQI